MATEILLFIHGHHKDMYTNLNKHGTVIIMLIHFLDFGKYVCGVIHINQIDHILLYLVWLAMQGRQQW